jgi:leader peptidase (prepilin peptidase)/N-methyltransferase
MGIGAGLFLGIHLLGSFFLKEESLGVGDIKLAAGIGAFLGWEKALLCFFLSFILGGIFAGILLLAHLKGRRDRIPFAPFLVIGAFVCIFFGERLIHFYLTFPIFGW